MKSAFAACMAILVSWVPAVRCQAQSFESGAAAWHFRWKAGQVLNYRIEQITRATETARSAGKVDTIQVSAKLNVIKRWQVQTVDSAGIATVQMSITSMRNEQIRPNGDVLLFDSAAPEKSTPALREQMTKYIGKILAVLRVDRYGKVVQVIQGSAAQFESDPPFVLRLPAEAPVSGRPWERTYQVTLDPPYGTGEKYEGRQCYALTKIADGLATIQMTTTLKLPETVAERIPLLQKQPAGDILFNFRAGRIERVNLQVDQMLEGHQGQGSSYRFQASRREQLVD